MFGDAEMKQSEVETDFGRDLIESLQEFISHQRGELALPTRIVQRMGPEQVLAISKSVA
jgi:hypothetical protein